MRCMGETNVKMKRDIGMENQLKNEQAVAYPISLIY